jgi:hypothetical protein
MYSDGTPATKRASVRFNISKSRQHYMQHLPLEGLLAVRLPFRMPRKQLIFAIIIQYTELNLSELLILSVF